VLGALSALETKKGNHIMAAKQNAIIIGPIKGTVVG
jgi:hypothetical protein